MLPHVDGRDISQKLKSAPVLPLPVQPLPILSPRLPLFVEATACDGVAVPTAHFPLKMPMDTPF